MAQAFLSWRHFRAVACEILVFQVPLNVVRVQPLCQDYLQQQGHQVYPSGRNSKESQTTYC